jgi:hypothetical protein
MTKKDLIVFKAHPLYYHQLVIIKSMDKKANKIKKITTIEKQQDISQTLANMNENFR